MFQYADDANEKDVCMDWRRDGRTPIQLLLAQPDRLLKIPARPSSVKILLDLPEKTRGEPRILALVAQKDPVLLACLLCLVGSMKQGSHANTAEEAITMLGVPRSFSAMVSIAKMSPTSVVSSSVDSLLSAAQRFVLERCLAHSLTAQKLARYLDLSAAQSSMLQVACLLDCLGLYVGIHANHGSAKVIQKELFSKIEIQSYLLRDSEIIPDYSMLAISLAGQWEASDEIIEILTSGAHPLHALLIAVEQMVEAKLRKTLEQEALVASVEGHACWKARVRLGKINLEVPPW